MKAATHREVPSEGRLYEALADRFAQLIDQGTFRPGDRIPSVRVVSREQQLSVSTVLHAFRLLENRGRIEARPQSGYYVRPPALNRLAEPRLVIPASTPRKPGVTDLIVRMLEASEVMGPRGKGSEGIIDFGAARPDPSLLPTKALNRSLAVAARRMSPQANRCPSVEGDRVLRGLVAQRLVRAGCALAPEDIIITNGCQEALNLALRAITQAGDTVAVESPTYFGILQLLESMGLRALEIPTCPREGVILEELAERLDARPVKACLFVLNFNNPLGSCMPDAKKAALVKLLAERRIPLIEDDIYGDVTFGAIRPKSAKAFDREGLVLTCDSFSKTIAPGFRIGWLAPGRFADRVRELKFVTTVGTATLPQVAIADYFNNGGFEHFLRKIRKAYESQIIAYSEAIEACFPAETRMSRPQGGWVLWVELPQEIDSLVLMEAAMAEGIVIAPGPLFSADRQHQNFIRINCGTVWSIQIESGLCRLGQIVSRMLETCRAKTVVPMPRWNKAPSGGAYGRG